MLLTLLATSDAIAQSLDTPAEILPVGCYTFPQRQKISRAIVDLEKCKIDLAERNILVNQRLLTFNGTPDIAWWQEPTAVVGGVVVGVAVGGILGALVLGGGK